MPHRLRAAVVLSTAALTLVTSTGPSVADAPPGATDLGAGLAATATGAAGTYPARAAARRVALAKAAAARKAAAMRANPLAFRRMGVYRGSGELAWPPYARAGGETKRLLGEIALRPKARWFGSWIGDGAIEGTVRDYVRNASGGNPQTLVQMAVFRMEPWEHAACGRLPSGREQASYRRWIDGFARGVGAQHAAIVVQPDGPFVDCVPHRSRVVSDLIAYATRKFAALPHAAVYIDGGAADWPPGNPSAAADFLVRDGIRYARGVALNSTHYSATGDEIERGAAIVQALARRGIRGKHVVINTSSNGRPFTFGTAPGKDPDDATACASRSSQHCVTLGIPPTTKVADPRWGLSASQRSQAKQYVDAYLWFGRPWLHRQAAPFDQGRALQLVRTSPYL